MNRSILLVTVILGRSMFTNGQASAVANHPFAPEDAAILRSATAVAIEPISGAILYRVGYGGEQGPTHTEWRIVDQNGSKSEELNLPPRFSPLGFTRDGESLYGSYWTGQQTQVAVLSWRNSTPASTPSVLTTLPRGIRAVVPSPDGSHYAILFDPRPVDPLENVRKVVEPDQTSLYVVDSDGGQGKRWCDVLTHITDLAWSSSGTSIAALSISPKIGFHDVRSSIDVCDRESIRGIAELANVAADLAWTNGDKELAFLSTTTHVLTPDHVWTVPVSGGLPKDRTPTLKGSALRLTGDVDGTIWVTVARGVHSEVDEFSADSLKTAYTWSTGTVEGLPVFTRFAGTQGTLALTVGDPLHTANVAVVRADKLVKITNEGDSQLGKIALGNVRIVQWTSHEGVPLEGIATFPTGYEEGRLYPFVVMPHGGPEENDNIWFDSTVRAIAGLGYIVLQPEYRGSTGYGSAFMEAIYQHRGDRAFHDVDSAADYAIAQGWADPKRLSIFGWSAGGYLAAWAVTQTNRYRAAIDGAGVTDWNSFVWTSDSEQIDFDTRWPDEDPDAFRRFSPVEFAAHVSTPLLILHGEADTRIPEGQSLEYFQALAARGKTVRMVSYPGSPHLPVLWQQKLNVLQEITDWLRRYNP